MAEITRFLHRTGFFVLFVLVLIGALVSEFSVAAALDELDVYYAAQTLSIRQDPTTERVHIRGIYDFHKNPKSAYDPNR